MIKLEQIIDALKKEYLTVKYDSKDDKYYYFIVTDEEYDIDTGMIESEPYRIRAEIFYSEVLGDCGIDIEMYKNGWRHVWQKRFN